MTGGLREISFGTGPAVGGISSTCTFARSSGAGVGGTSDLAFDFEFELELDLDLDLDLAARGAGGGIIADTEALKIVPSFGDRCREIVCVKEVLKVAREVRVELPLGRRMRRS